jgi:glycosyltransferase involved in cell wall biosynthesis
VDNTSAKPQRLFSIVTATFNAGRMLDRTIESVRSQSCKDFEWIVIDGGSRDDSVARIKAAGGIIARWISEPDEGIADAWNKGLSFATGAHALILNAGDTYDPEFLATIAARCNGRQIVCTHARLSTGDGRSAGVFRARPAKLPRGMYLPHNWCAVPLPTAKSHWQWISTGFCVTTEGSVLPVSRLSMSRSERITWAAPATRTMRRASRPTNGS